MKFTVVETLGDMVSYSSNEVKVVKSVDDKVPMELKADFHAVVEAAATEYFNKVAECKSKGEKPKSAAIKKETVEKIKEWMRKNGLSTDGSVKRITATRVRIPADNEVVRVVQKKDFFVDVQVSTEEISSVFDNFDSESLSDESVVVEETTDFVDLGDDLFEGDLLEGLDDF